MQKVILLFISLLLGASVFSQSRRSPLKDTQADITGVWQAVTVFDEHESTDTFIVLNFKGRYGIVCPSYEHFGITEIKKRGSSLEFIMVNTLSKEEIYIMDYECKIINEDNIKCLFVNQLGVKEDNITWKRIKDY